MIQIKKQQKMLNASVTLEAAIIVPFIVIIIMLLLYLSFFLHNRCVISQITYISALRGCLSEETGEKREQELLKEEKDLLQGRTIVGNGTNLEHKIENEKVTVNGVNCLNIPFAALTKEFRLKNSWTFSVKYKAENIDAVTFIRRCRKLENIL